jgi:tetratricopeptide (TPR) repeat protein
LKTKTFLLAVVCLLTVFFIFLFLIVQFLSADSNAEFEKALSLFENQRYSEAREILLEYVRRHDRHSEAWYYLSNIALRENRIDDAYDYIKHAIAIEESSTALSKYYFHLGNIYGFKAMEASILRKPARARSARRSFETSVELDPDNNEARMGLIMFYTQAPGIMGGSMSKALEQVEEIKKRDPVQGHLAMANIHRAENNLEEAERECIAAREIDPSNPMPYMILITIYESMGDYAKGWENLESLISKIPDYVPAYYQYGRFSDISGENIEPGKEYFKKYIEKSQLPDSPSHAWAHYRLGNLYLKDDNIQQAHYHYEKALELDPDHEQTKEALGR